MKSRWCIAGLLSVPSITAYAGFLAIGDDPVLPPR